MQVNLKYETARRRMIIGIIGCLLYVAGDFLFAATGKGQRTDTIGLFTRVAYLEMSTWRMIVSILCGFVGTLMYYMGFHQMYRVLRIHLTMPGDQIWVRLFRAAYIMGSVSWAWVHAMFMTDALIFKYVVEAYGETEKAAEIANRVFLANGPGMLTAYIVCDMGLTVIMMALVLKRKIPLKNTGTRLLALLCNPLMLPGIVGNLLTLLPWPLNQLDHGTESFGHALVLILGMTLLRQYRHRNDALELLPD